MLGGVHYIGHWENIPYPAGPGGGGGGGAHTGQQAFVEKRGKQSHWQAVVVRLACVHFVYVVKVVVCQDVEISRFLMKGKGQPDAGWRWKVVEQGYEGPLWWAAEEEHRQVMHACDIVILR